MEQAPDPRYIPLYTVQYSIINLKNIFYCSLFAFPPVESLATALYVCNLSGWQLRDSRTQLSGAEKLSLRVSAIDIPQLWRAYSSVIL